MRHLEPVLIVTILFHRNSAHSLDYTCNNQQVLFDHVKEHKQNQDILAPESCVFMFVNISTTVKLPRS